MGKVFPSEDGNPKLTVLLLKYFALDLFPGCLKLTTGTISVASAGNDQTLRSQTLIMGAASTALTSGGQIRELLTEIAGTPVVLGGETVGGLSSNIILY